MTRTAFVGLAFVAFFGCSDDPEHGPSNVEGPEPDASTPVDALVTASEPCAPGTRAAVGTTECVAVGTTTCAPGFAKDPSGWGCAAVLPADACTGATRPALGETTCVPIGDCGGIYPPPGAIIVDPSLADSAVDATHVKTFAAALAVAIDDTTISFADGEHVVPAIDVGKAVNVVGRCAAKTKLVPDVPGAGGIRVLASASVKNVTIAGMDTALEINGAAASLALEHVLIEGSLGRAVFPRNGAKTTMRDVVVRGTVARTTGAQTIAVLVGNGAHLDMEDSAIVDSFDGALAATDAAAARVTVKRSVIDRSTGTAVRVFEGAKLEMAESLVRNAGGMGVLVLHQKAGTPEVVLTRSVVANVEPVPDRPDEDIGTALNAAYGAIMKVDDSTVADTRGIAAYVTQSAKLTMTNSAIVRARENEVSSGYGVSATKQAELVMTGSVVIEPTGLGIATTEKARAHVERSLIRGVSGVVSSVTGLKVGFGLNVLSGSSLDFVDSSIVDAIEIGIATDGSGSRVLLDKALVARTPGAAKPEYGHGVLSAFEGIVDVRGSILDGHAGAALFYAGGGGTVTQSLVRGNAIGVHVQEGSALIEADVAPDTSTVPVLVVTSDVRFEGNATKTGSGELPLPKLDAGL